MAESNEEENIRLQAELEAFAFELSIFELKCAEEISELIVGFEEVSPEAVEIGIKKLVSEFENSQSTEASKSVFRLLVKLIGDRRYQEKVGLDKMIAASLSSSASLEKNLLVDLQCQLMKLKLRDSARTEDPWLMQSLQMMGELISEERTYQRGRALTRKVAVSLFGFTLVRKLCISLWIDKKAIFYALPWLWETDEVRDCMPKLLITFKSLVLASKQGQFSNLNMKVTSFFVGIMDSADLKLKYAGGDESVLDVLLNMMKKSPEGSAYAVSTIVAKLSPEMNLASFASSGGLISSLRMLKSTRKDCRAYGRDLFLSLCKRCVSDPQVLTGTIIQLFDAMVVRSESPMSRSAAAACLISLCKDYPDLASAVATDGHEQVLKGMQSVATYMDKESDRACSIMLGLALGCWMHVLSSQSEGKNIEKGNPLVNQHFQQKIEAHLKAAKGVLPALVTLNEAVTENGEVRCNIEAILSSLLIIARKASASSVSEATIALTLLLRVHHQSVKLIDKSDCWDSFIGSKSFLHYLPIAKEGNDSEQAKDTEEASSLANFPKRLRTDMWRLDGSEVLQVIAGQGRVYCLQFLVEMKKIQVIAPERASVTRKESVLDLTVDQFSSLSQLTNHAMAADGQSCAILDSPSFEQSIICCMLSANREVRSIHSSG